jgi:hypothetical protein
VGNSPTNGTDPSGLDGIMVSPIGVPGAMEEAKQAVQDLVAYTQNGMTLGQAAMVSLLRRLPLTGGVFKLVEAWDGQSLAGADLGRDLSTGERVVRGIAGGVEVGAAAIPLLRGAGKAGAEAAETAAAKTVEKVACSPRLGAPTTGAGKHIADSILEALGGGFGEASEQAAASGAGDFTQLRKLVQFLRQEGVTDPGVRRSMIEAGVEAPIGSDTPITLARFRKLFPETIARGKEFTGRLGDIETRVATLNEAAAMERAGFQPRFEFPVRGAGRTVFADLACFDRTTRQPARIVQFLRALQKSDGSIYFYGYEGRNAALIDKAYPGLLEFFVTAP